MVRLPSPAEVGSSDGHAARDQQSEQDDYFVIDCTDNRQQDGIELQAHNGFGHFALIKPLIPALKKTAEEPGSHVRLVQVSSMGHNFAAKTRDFASVEVSIVALSSACIGANIDTQSVNAGTSVWECYGQSKLSNILLANELQKRLADTNIYSLSLHPGVIATVGAA